MKLDEFDHQILELLRKNSRMPFTDVGKALEVSDATIHVRVKRMVEGGIIKRFTVEVDSDALGTKVHGFILLNVHPGSLKEVVNQMIKYKEVDAVYEIHGSNDLIMKVETEDLNEMRNLILQIREVPKVTTSELIPVFKVWKEKYF